MLIFLAVLVHLSCSLTIAHEVKIEQFDIHHPIQAVSEQHHHLIISSIPNLELKVLVYDMDENQALVIDVRGNGPGELANYIGGIHMKDKNSFVLIDHIAHKFVKYEFTDNQNWVVGREAFFNPIELLFSIRILSFRDEYMLIYTDLNRLRTKDRIVLYKWDREFKSNSYVGEITLRDNRKSDDPPYPGRIFAYSYDNTVALGHTHKNRIWIVDPDASIIQDIPGLFREPSDVTINLVQQRARDTRIRTLSSTILPYYDWFYTNGAFVIYDWYVKANQRSLIMRSLTDGNEDIICHLTDSERLLNYEKPYLLVPDKRDDENWKLVFYVIPEI